MLQQNFLLHSTHFSNSTSQRVKRRFPSHVTFFFNLSIPHVYIQDILVYILYIRWLVAVEGRYSRQGLIGKGG